MGGFDPALGSVTLCEKNLNREKNSYLNVIKHELAHVVQHRMGRNGDALMPSSLLAPLVRELLPQKEVMAVLMQYPAVKLTGNWKPDSPVDTYRLNSSPWLLSPPEA